MSRRAFSLAPLLESAVSAAHTTLTTLHAASGTPWFLTIPLFALALNLLARLPATVYSRRVAMRRQRLAPLVRAWTVARARPRAVAAGRNGEAEGGGDEEGSAAAAGPWTRMSPDELMKRAAAEATLRNRRLGVQGWKDWVPMVTVFPVWLAGIEALRRMCGGPRGLLGNMIFGAKALEEGGKEVAADGAAAGDGALASVPVEQVGELHEALTGVGSAAGADMSMTTGGCLWFPDLMVADPLHILPFALSAVLIFNLMPRSREHTRLLFGQSNGPEALLPGVKWRLRMQRALMMLALVAGPATMDLPAALHVYWISSAVLTSIQTQLIYRWMPLPETVAPAKEAESPFVIPKRREGKRP
jgi:inner membrane protein COX18